MRNHPSYWAALFHSLMLALAFSLVAGQLALPAGIAAGIAAIVLASLWATWTRRRGIRLVPALFFGFLVGGGAASLSLLVTQWGVFAEIMGLRNTLEVADGLRVGGAAFALVVLLRVAALHARIFLVIEAALVTGAVALPVAAHRDGMIARPLVIADWFWQQGVDPVYAFLALGAAGALLVAGVLATGQRPIRIVYQLGIVILIAVVLSIPLYRRSAEATLFDSNFGGKGGQAKDAQSKASGQSQPQRPGTAEDKLKQQQDGKGGQQRPMAVVVFHKDVEPLGGVFYFRHAAFSQFNGTRLVESTDGGADKDVVWRFPSIKKIVPGPAEGTLGRTLVATDVALISDHRRVFTLNDAVEVEPMANPSAGRFKRAYRVVSSVVDARLEDLLGQKPGSRDWTSDLWAHYTSLPDDSRYFELATRIDSTLKNEFRNDPMARALAVKRYLEETTIYSFAPRYSGPDPTAQFLFTEGDRKGFCTHIAHGAAFLLRALNIPARVSAGYGVMAENLRGGSSLLIKSGDAHAWLEIYLSETGWVPIEIVPNRTEFEPPPFQEEDLQRLLGEMARGEGRETIVADESPQILAKIRAFIQKLPWVLLIFVLCLYLVRIYRFIRPYITPEAVHPAYRASLDQLATFGFVRKPGESREQFAVRVSANAPSFQVLSDRLIRRVIGPDTSVVHRTTAVGLVSELGRELADIMPLWRRLLAWLHPAPWWWAK